MYGIGTVAGNLVAGRIKPDRITRVLPVPLAVLTITLATQGLALRTLPTALISVFALGASAFVVAPTVQTWLMGRVGAAGAGLIAASTSPSPGLAGALGAALGSAVLAHGGGLDMIGPAAAPIVAVGLAVALVLGRTPAGMEATAAVGKSTRPELCDAAQS